MSHVFSGINKGIGILKSFKWAYWYHLGSIAFGSLIILITTLPRGLALLFKAITWFLRRFKERSLLYYLFACLTSIIKCMEKLFEYASSHAFVEVILVKKPFITGMTISYVFFVEKVFTIGAVVGLVTVIMKVTMGFSILLISTICFYAI